MWMARFKHLELGFWLATLAAFSVYMFIGNETGFRPRTWGEFSDALFYLTLGWFIRSAIAERE